MLSRKSFIKATEEFNTFEQNVPAYYFRKSFNIDDKKPIKITISACGFYDLYLNGQRITRGLLSPYISNSNDYIYYDEYDVLPDLGENVVGVILGNGFQNNPGGYIWCFDVAPFRSAPMFALNIVQQSDDGSNILLESSDDFRIAPSPIRCDDYRFGEYYDANFEIEGWNQKGFDDSAWDKAMYAKVPDGDLRRADINPIVKECEIHPVDIIKCGDDYIYDFGVSHAGICRLSICGYKGQKIELCHSDSLKDGDINLVQVWFVRDKWERDKDIVHRDTYVCKGVGQEIYQPTFTYHGFRYVKVSGINSAQATKDLLTYLVYHTDLDTRGDFTCSHDVATKLQEITRRSIVSNFHHFPTDCPQREKNGWTADAALSCEAALLNFNPERNYREWQRNICKAQREDGALPGIVPTGGWGFLWGNGPAWDCVLAYIPYYTYIYRGETQMIIDSAQSFLSYLRYLRGRADDKGLICIGLGDWCHVGMIPPKAPLVLTDTIMSMDIANKMADMFEVVGMCDEATYARGEAIAYKAAIRDNLIDFDTMCVVGNCQTSQAMCLFYGAFDDCEKDVAFDRLLQMVHQFDDHIDVGVLGGRVIFHVLTEFGYSELAYKMITREDYPSYGNWLARGATTLWENFLPDDVASMNHHFWGDISAWFIKCITGIRLNPTKRNVNLLEIKPSFISGIDHASAYHIAPSGKISVSWTRKGCDIILDVVVPSDISAVAILDKEFCFENGKSSIDIVTGSYKIFKRLAVSEKPNFLV